MAKWNMDLCDMHRIEAQHLREKLRIAMQVLETLAQDRNDLAQRALQRIKGYER